MQTHTPHRLTWLQYCKQECNKAVVQQKEEGFTLIELLLVIGIIAILASIVILAINPTANIQSAQNASANKQAREIQNAIIQHVIQHGAAPNGIGGTPMVLCAPGFEVVDGCEINLEDEIANETDSEYSFISQVPVAANRDTLGLPEYDSGFRVSFDGSRYTVTPTATTTSLVASTFEMNFGGTDPEMAYAVEQTSDGGYIFVGTTNSSDGDVSSGNNGASDIWAVKTDSSGAIEWEQAYGGSSADNAFDVQQTSDGGYIIGGRSLSSDGDVGGNNGGFDYWIVKISSTGVLEWEQNYGGSGSDSLQTVQQTSDGGYILGGHTQSSNGDVSSNNGSSDFWLVKTNSTGVLEWEQNYGGSSSDLGAYAETTVDGGYIIVGQSRSTDGDASANNGSVDYWLVKTNSTGVLEWEQNYGGPGYDGPSSVQQTSDGGYIIAGYTDSVGGDVSSHNGGGNDFWLVKTSSTGVLEWEQNYGGSGPEMPRNIQQTTDGGYIILGDGASVDGDWSSNNGFYDVWAVKINSVGTIEWEHALGGSSMEAGLSARQTSDGGYIIAAASLSTDGDVSANYGNYDYWVVKLDSSGEL